jgi:hypothetical protein
MNRIPFASPWIFLLCALWMAGLSSDARSQADVINEDAKLIASDGDSLDTFGWSVGISGDAAIVGAPHEGELGHLAGAAYISRSDGVSWSEEAKLLPSTGSATDEFGFAVDISGDVALVGAPGDSSGGAAFVFRYDGSTWNEEDRFLPSSGLPDLEFGAAVSIDGNVAVIGALRDNSAAVFRFDGSAWSEDEVLVPSDGGSAFGRSVSVSGDVIVVGDDTDSDLGFLVGSAYVFRFDGAAWVEEEKLVASDWAEGEQFGYDVAVRGNEVVVGVPHFIAFPGPAGAAYVFRFDGMNWVEDDKLVSSDGEALDRFGNSVGISGDRIVVGAPTDDDQGLASGVVFLFSRSDSGWVETDKLLASDGVTGNWYGWDVDFVAGVAIASALFEDQLGESAGAAYLFENLCDLTLDGPDPGTAGVVNTLTATCGTAGEPIFFVFGVSEGTTRVPGCPGVDLGIANPRILGSSVADADGVASFNQFVPNVAAGVSVLLQAVDPATCRVSNLVQHTFPD